MRRFLAGLLEVIEIALIAALAVYAIRHFLVQPFLVSGRKHGPEFS
jgi:signal peptidase I